MTSSRRSSPPASDIQVLPVHFYSDGARISGDLFLPTGVEGPWPGVVVCHGFGGVKTFYVGDIARRYAELGIAALIFDYRGVGESEGVPNRAFPLEQVADTLAAVTWLSQWEGLAHTQIGVYGEGYGGGIAIAAAGMDPRIRAAVSTVGIADSGRWLRDMRPPWEWFKFYDLVRRDSIRRVLSGNSEVVPTERVFVRSPESQAHEAMLRANNPGRPTEIGLDSAEAMMRFRPIDYVASISPRAVMLVGVEDDTTAPFDHTLALYQAALEPKRLMNMHAIAHYEIYQPHNLERVLVDTGAFFLEYLREDPFVGLPVPDSPCIVGGVLDTAHRRPRVV